MNRQGRILKNWLEKSDAVDQNFFKKIMNRGNGSARNTFSFAKLIDHCTKDLAADSSPEDLFGALIDAMDQYLVSYSAPPSYRQKLYKNLQAWALDIGEKHQISHYRELLADFYPPINKDPVIGLIQDLHSRNGITKHDLALKYGVSLRMVQSNLHRLDADFDGEPFRIAGQAVQVSVEKVSVNDEMLASSRQWRFWTPNTLNPLVLQCNLMQVATLLKSFYYSYAEHGNLIPFDMAVDVWIQLSDYAKERIKEIFGRQEESFSDFLLELEDASSEDLHVFHTEKEMQSEMKVSEEERLLMAYKGSEKCRVWIADKREWIKNQRIHYDRSNRCYYAEDQNDPKSGRYYLKEDDKIYY